MLQSQLFTKTRKEGPKDEVSRNADLLIRAGFIHKEMAGVYSYLPLGLRVFQNIVRVIREEMNAIGGQEVTLTSLQEKDIWEKTGRWSDDVIDVWFKTKLKNDTLLGLATTHEEPLTHLMKSFVSSYRDLPCYVYQFQTKFRNELRSKSGIMRVREFVMKDLYSFSRTQEEHDRFYEVAKNSYTRIFERIGLGESTYVVFASGGSFSKYSHEFQTLTTAGEDTIYVNKEKKIAINAEVLNDEVLHELGLSRDSLEEQKAVEVGNIFNLGTKFASALGLEFQDENGEKKPVIMGSYGIGPGRLIGTIVETLSDDKGIIWPESVAPFLVHLIEIPGKETETHTRAQSLYGLLRSKMEVLYDDRDIRAGEKFNDADLIGIPYHIIVSDRGNQEKTVEIKKRKTGETLVVSENSVQDLSFTKLFS